MGQTLQENDPDIPSVDTSLPDSKVYGRCCSVVWDSQIVVVVVVVPRVDVVGSVDEE